ncbi:MAG: hypothetical protein IRZ13_14490, partial [Acetobacteraceae bacterium]|nr:hypothetical protein [Acetobacteraceae bacterium]
MSRPGGQAWRWVRRAVGAVFALAILGGLAVGGLAWRLAQGPMDLPALAREIERRANAETGDMRLEIGSARIAWEGWRAGNLSPIEFLLDDVRLVELTTGQVRAALPAASVTLSLSWLLRGEIAPRVIELHRPVLRLVRGEDGAIRLGIAAEAPAEAEAAAPPSPEDSPASADAGAYAARLLAELMRPPSQATPVSALRRVEVQGGLLLIVDRQLDRVWWLQQPQLALRRQPEGGLQGEGTATLRLGPEWVPIRLSGSASGEPARVELGLALPSIRPGALARAAPGLAPLGMLDATVEAAFQVALDGRTWQPEAAQATLRAGPGTVALGEGRRIAIAGLEASGSVTPNSVRVERAVLRLA